MPNHQVFIIHGMGDYEKDWSLNIQEEIGKTFAAYKKVNALAYIKEFDFVEVLYDDVFEKWRQMWKADAAAAAAAASAVGLDSGIADKLVELAQSPTGGSFFQTHVLDVVMYRYLKQFREEVDQKVRERIMGHLDAFPVGQLPTWSAIAHSLGTSVLHNTLHGMFTHPVNGVLLGDAYMPAYLFMVANVGKVLWNLGGDFYASKVKPHVLETKGLCWKYCNFDHQLDPFTHVDRFDPPPDWFPADVEKKRVFANVKIQNDDVQDLNVHAISHYWSHPDVHCEIIRTLLDNPRIIDAQEHNDALVEWRKKALKGAAKAKLQAELKALQTKKKSDWASIAESLAEFRKEVIKRGLYKRDGETVK